MSRPLSVDQIAKLLKSHGDNRSLDAIRVHVIRAIESGSLGGAYKVNPDKVTSPWLVPAESVQRWLDGSRREDDKIVTKIGKANAS